jgi:uncharacterized protein YodC (DUF2158 family)
MTAFKSGDVVQLRSGGPKMTVASINGPKVVTTWFVSNKLQRGMFSADTLALASDEPSRR